MLHAYAIEPKVACTWGKIKDFRYFFNKFGLGTPRILYEIPKFSKWRSHVIKNFLKRDYSDIEKKNLEMLIQCFDKSRFKHPNLSYDGTIDWLENAEMEYDRFPFSGIIAEDNPRSHKAVIRNDSIGMEQDRRWDRPTGIVPKRNPEEFADALEGILLYCKEILLIDPHFGPENSRHKQMIEAFVNKISKRVSYPERFEIHCSDKIANLDFFEEQTQKLTAIVPKNLKLSFYSWRERPGGEKFHNRYILTEHCGVTIGTGLDKGKKGQSDDINLMSAEQYQFRKNQFRIADSAFDLVDQPKPIIGRA